MSIWNMTNIVVRYSRTLTDHFDDNIDIGDGFWMLVTDSNIIAEHGVRR